ncbi:MAG: Na+/H+ antiporter NhaA [Flavobacteriaceae bacterium]|nr:Na+/H+ antiporter NhaA [Flavobacteriaceae bacterium]
MRTDAIDRMLIIPMTRFINNSTTSGIVLFISAVLALILANSPLKDAYHHLWEHKFTIGFDQYAISKSIHHWINDGLMSIFFFVVGLELKREIVGGHLSNVKDALLPMVAGLGGMVVPAAIYLFFNSSGEASNGWGVPMATDIAFALGIIYTLGNRVPVALKVFLTALAIADDLGAVLVIAFFYTSDISGESLLIGGGFLGVLIVSNLLGVRNVIYYGVVGIIGLWLAFLLSGVHATVAGVLAAFTIPANVKIQDRRFMRKMKKLTMDFENLTPNDVSLVTHDQLHVIEKIRFYARNALTPLQRLEHSMHPIVAFVVMPIFALANAGITFSGGIIDNILSNVSLGVIFGLVVGKFVGITAMCKLLVKFKLAKLPESMNWKHVYGASLLAAVGFTMSLFITDLAFSDPLFKMESKAGIFIASIIGGTLGYFLLKSAGKDAEIEST